MTFLGRIQGRDLPGQVVISGPGGELVDAHRHTHPKGVHAAGAVRPTGATSGGAWGVSDLKLRNFERGTSDAGAGRLSITGLGSSGCVDHAQ